MADPKDKTPSQVLMDCLYRTNTSSFCMQAGMLEVLKARVLERALEK